MTAAADFAVRIGINPISWMNDDLPSLGGDTPLTTALAEGAAIGYRGFELGNKFPREPGALKQLLDGYGLACVSGWYSGRLAEQGRSATAEAADLERHLDLLVRTGADVLVYGETADAIQGRPLPLRQRPRFYRQAQWQTYAEKLTALAEHTLSRGVRLAYHHHMGAYVESPEDIDQLMALTGPAVGLLFDTGHLAFGGGDPLTVLRRHIGRVAHVHCKDWRPTVARMARNRDWSFLDAVLNGAFTVPGDGAIDFAPLLGLLHEHGYAGWLVVEAEQDPAVAPSERYARRGHDHLAALVRECAAGRYRSAA